MSLRIYWVEDYEDQQQGILSRPRSEDWLLHDIHGLFELGINTIVSLLTPEETRELGLLAEAEYCQRYLIEFINFPIQDRGIPDSFEKTVLLVKRLSERLNKGKKVVVHCRAGIGRSSLIIGCVLVYTGIMPAAAYAMIGASRGLQVPDTEGQMTWLSDFSHYLMATE